jgi:lipoate-protein ligase A
MATTRFISVELSRMGERFPGREVRPVRPVRCGLTLSAFRAQYAPSLMRAITVVHDSAPLSPGLDTALSRALLLRVSNGALGETFRLHFPGRVMAFGKRDVISPGYPEAVSATRAMGFAAVERLAGGRAAVFHEGTLAFSWSIPTDDPRRGIHDRFQHLSGLLLRSFQRLGVAAAIGELPGEYCPGEYSIHAGGRKVMGVGQRLARSAAHIGGVIVVSGGKLARDALVPVYDALDLNWDPTTAGSLQDVDPSITLQRTVDAVLETLADGADLFRGSLDAATLSLAKSMENDHLSPA